jgi:hypothetical protein
MTPTLKRFLTTEDLDDLQTAHAALSNLDPSETQEILSILTVWTDTQAIANLLMHPDLIPESGRFSYLLKGLRESTTAYFALAATVGLQTLKAEAFSENERTQIIEQVLGLMKSGQEAIAGRASISIANYVEAKDAPMLLGMLDRNSDVIKHNILVAAIRAAGFKNIKMVIGEFLKSSNMSASTRQFLERGLAELDEIIQDGVVDQLEFLTNAFSAPILTYIPNLNEGLIG